MNAIQELLFPTFGLFSASLVLTALSLWVGGRLTPWFMQEAVDPPTVMSYFFDPEGDTRMSRARLVTMGIASVIMLAVLLAVAVWVKFVA